MVPVKFIHCFYLLLQNSGTLLGKPKPKRFLVKCNTLLLIFRFGRNIQQCTSEEQLFDDGQQTEQESPVPFPANLYFLGLVLEAAIGGMLLQQAKLIKKRICEERNVGNDDKATASWRVGRFHRYTHRTREDTPPSESVPLCW